MSELVSNGVQIYQFPTDDEAVSEINASMNVSHVLSLCLSINLRPATFSTTSAPHLVTAADVDTVLFAFNTRL